MAQASDTTGNYWHDGAPEKLPDDIRELERILTPARVIDAVLLRLYFASPDGIVDSMSIVTGQLEKLVGDLLNRRMRFNLIKSVIDAYCAMVVQVPSIDVTTTGGSHSQRRAAEALGLWVDGTFEHNQMRGLTWRCVIDSCLTRAAAAIVDLDKDNKSMSIDRLAPHWLVWNPLEGPDPRNLYTKRPVSRAYAMKLAGKDPVKRKYVEDAMPYRPDPLFEGIDGIFAERMSDMIELYEGHRKADSDGKGGKYVCVVETAGGKGVLADDVYRLPMHRIVPLRYSPSYQHFAGQPAGDTLLMYQNELDDISATLKEAFVKGSVLRVIVDKGAEVDEKELNDTQGQIIHKNPGSELEFNRGTAPPPEYIAREQQMIERAHDFMGISYNAARGVKADGISSAKGQREVAALAQNRLVLNMQTLQDWHVAIAKVEIALADDFFRTEKKEIEVTAPGANLLRRVKWSSINYKQTDFLIHCDAINALSRHPSARVDEVLELVQGGVLDQKQALKVIGSKDLQAARDEAFAMADMVEKLIELALDGDFRVPDPYLGADGLQMVIERGRNRYLQEMVQENPSEHLGDLRRLIEAAKTELAQAQKPAPAEGAGPPVNGQAAGGGEAPQLEAPAAMAAPEIPANMPVGGAGLPNVAPSDIAPPPVPGQGLG